jgi:RNA recognition motif-containing protein
MNIYVANLDTQWNDDRLREMFVPYGTVDSAKVMIDGFTERSRGFGYVEMPVDEEALAAIAALNETEVGGKKLSLKQADPREVRKGSYKVGNGGINPYRFKKS